MYLHLGGDVVVKQEKIVVILDLDTAKKTAEQRFLPDSYQNEKRVIYVSEPGKEKSLIITTDGYYLSPISSTTLLKRSFFVDESDEN